MRRAAKRDETEAPIVEGLRRLGFQVKILNDTPDLIVRNPWNGRITLLEVDGVTKHRKRSGAQLDFLHEWSITRVTKLDEALIALRKS